MAILTTRDKQSILFAAVPAVLVLTAVGLFLEYWYVTVPLLLVAIAIPATVVLVRRHRYKPVLEAKRVRYVEEHTHVLRPGAIDWSKVGDKDVE